MELIVISASKLKIMLTDEDLHAYSLDCSTLDYENTETRRAFWSILDEAKHRTGFDAASEKVFVQVYPSRGGGCEMYVTKLGMFSGGGAYDEEDEEMRIVGSNSKGGDAVRKNPLAFPDEVHKETKMIRRKPITYRFGRIDELISACKRLSLCGYTGESRAYKSEGKCYLLLECDEKTEYGYDKRALISEYAEEVELAFFEIYIGEYGSFICEKNAVETLGDL